MRLFLILSSVSLLVFTTACSEKRERIAPVNESELGILINLDEETVNTHFLNTKPIGSKDFLPFTEIMGASLKEVKAAFPNALVAKNSFLKEQNFKSDANFKNTSLNDFKEFNNDLIKEEFNLRDCIRAPEELTANIDFVDEANVPRYLLETDTLLLTSRGSKARNNKTYKSAWAVIPPMGSLLKPELVLGSEYEVKFDMAGNYKVNLFIKQGINCEVETIQVPVTSNPEFIEQDLNFLSATKDAINEEFKDSLFAQKELMGIKEAKSKSLNGQGIVTAILDSGINYNSPFFAGRIWKNKRESFNGLDDDQNGLKDDVIGYDFVNGDEFPMDDSGHGSHIAGLLAGSLIGVAENSSLMAVKVTNSLGRSDTGTVLNGLKYAILNKADIINMSIGSEGIDPDSEEIFFAIYEEARKRDILIVAAAGNLLKGKTQARDIDRYPIYPASLGFDNILTVGASDADGDLAYYSNFGRRSVDLLAFGGIDKNPETGKPVAQLLYSAYIPNPAGVKLRGLVGTSMSAPLVSGMTAILRGENDNLTSFDIINLMKTSVDVNPDLESLVGSSGVANINKALQKLPSARLIN